MRIAFFDDVGGARWRGAVGAARLPSSRRQGTPGHRRLAMAFRTLPARPRCRCRLVLVSADERHTGIRAGVRGAAQAQHRRPALHRHRPVSRGADAVDDGRSPQSRATSHAGSPGAEDGPATDARHDAGALRHRWRTCGRADSTWCPSTRARHFSSGRHGSHRRYVEVAREGIELDRFAAPEKRAHAGAGTLGTRGGRNRRDQRGATRRDERDSTTCCSRPSA